jgi:hypothetical protein
VSKKEPTMESANSISKGGTLVATMTGGNTPTPSEAVFSRINAFNETPEQEQARIQEAFTRLGIK